MTRPPCHALSGLAAVLALWLALPVAAQAVPDGPMETTLQTSVSSRGVTLTFRDPVLVGRDVMGRPIILTTERDVVVVDDSPASRPIPGKAGGFIGNGIMRDPFRRGPDGARRGQGFDQLTTRGPKPTMYIPYAADRNVAPSIAGPLVIPKGSETTLVKGVRRRGATTPGTVLPIADYVAFTFLARRPPADAYAPGMADPDKTLIFRKSDRNMDALQRLPLPPGLRGQVTRARALRGTPPTLPFFGWSGEGRRRFGPDDDYSQHWTRTRRHAWNYLHSDAPDAAKDAVADLVIRHGIDLYAAWRRGWRGSAGAGQHHGYHPYLYMAAFLLGSEDMLEAAQQMNSNMVGYPNWPDSHYLHWVQPRHVGAAVDYPTSRGTGRVYGQTFFREHVGQPILRTGRGQGTLPTARYYEIATAGMKQELLPVILLRDGPHGETGIEAVLRGGPLDASNYNAAPVAWMDVAVSFDPTPFQDPLATRLHAAWRDAVTPGRFHMVPYQFDKGVREGFQSIRGGFAWDFTGHDYSTLPVTHAVVEYSLDHRLWTRLGDQPTQGFYTGLIPGRRYYVRIAFANALGTGIPTRNFPLDAPEAKPRGVVVPKFSSPDAAPRNTLRPAIGYKAYPAWQGPSFDAAPAEVPLDPDRVRLACALGDWRASPDPDFSFRWLRNGRPIAGADGPTHIRETADQSRPGAPVRLACEVTAANDIGPPVRVRSREIEMPMARVLPEGTLIDTGFGPRFRLDFPEIRAGFRSRGAQAWLPPTATARDEDGTPRRFDGALAINKTGAYPRLSFPVAGGVPGERYRLTATVLGRGWTGDGALRIGAPGAETPWTSVFLWRKGPEIRRVEAEFTIPEDHPETAPIEVTALIGTATGGRAGGNLRLADMTIRRIAAPAGTDGLDRGPKAR